jgi:hypothetical protein
MASIDAFCYLAFVAAGAVEQRHFGNPTFHGNGKIFAEFSREATSV